MTKTTLLVIAVVGLNAAATRADTRNVTGTAARDLMEAVVATGLPLKDLTADGKGGLVDRAGKQADFHHGPITIETGRLQCDYSAGAPFPDELKSAIECNIADKDGKLGKTLANPLALAAQLERQGAKYEAHTGGRTLRVTSLSCTRDGGTGKYTCQLSL
jgi:hypothetical protein